MYYINNNSNNFFSDLGSVVGIIRIGVKRLFLAVLIFIIFVLFWYFFF